MDISGHLPIAYPQALVLGAALAWVYWRYLRRRNAWRNVAVLLAIALLCYPILRRGSKAMDLIVLVDRSRSISDEGRAKEREILDLVNRRLEKGDRIGVVSFSADAHIEKTPSQGEGVPASFQIPYSPDASDLAEGLRTALGLVHPRRHARLLLLSDGEYTAESPMREAMHAARLRVPVFYRDLQPATVLNLAVDEVELPDKVLASEPFRVTFHVNATAATEGRYRVWRNERVVGTDQANGWRHFAFQPGDNIIHFTDISPAPGIQAYRLEVESTPAEAEVVRKDNTARRFVKVLGERPVLLVNNTGAPDNIASVLSAGGQKTHIVAVGDYRMDLRALTGYKGVILNNVALLSLSVGQIDALRRFVTEEGAGLLVCGGNRSFQKGGYYKTAVADILPVTLEDRQESRKVATAFSIVLDRSGSMTMPTPGGQTKMELANEAAAECIMLLGAADSVSVVAVDSQAHIVLPQQSVESPDYLAHETRRIESMGGGIFVYTGLVAAGREVSRAEQTNKHILLFADAADAEEPGKYKSLITDFRKAGITVSVVGLGTEHDPDAEFLKDVAKRGEGSIYFTQDAGQLVQFFTADTMNYTRNNFVEEPAPMQVTAGAWAIAPEQRWPRDFACGGYNLLFAHPDAGVAIRTTDDDQAPVLAFWQRGLGRAAALALDAEGPFADNKAYADIVLSAARWIMGSEVEESFQTRVRYEGSAGQVQLAVSDEERAKLGLATLTVFTPSGQTIEKPLQWDTANRLSAPLRFDEQGMYRGVIRAGGRTLALPPMSAPVSPEFRRRRQADFGRRALADLASRTGGAEVLDLRRLFERRERSDAIQPLLTPFLVAFLLLFLLDIAEARFGLIPWISDRAGRVLQRLGVRRRTLRKPSRSRTSQSAEPDPASRPVRTQPEKTQPQATEEESPDKPPDEEPASDDGMDYLSQSKHQAGKRLGGRRY